MLALRWSPCPYCAGVIVSITHASLPALRQRCAGVVVRASLLCHVGVIALVSPVSPLVSRTGVYPVPMPWRPGIFTRLVLASLLALRWCSCPHHAGFIASIALSLSPALCQHCPPRRVGISTLLHWRFSPRRPLHCCQRFNLLSAQSCRSRDMSAYVVLLLSPRHRQWLCCRPRRHSTATWPSMVRPMQHWHLFRHCAGVLAPMLLASS